jgi:hypothetical protein
MRTDKPCRELEAMKEMFFKRNIPNPGALKQFIGMVNLRANTKQNIQCLLNHEKET